MNFLAHLYLSPNNTEIMIGNFIADHIKGNKYKHYAEDIQNGIILHRSIDTFTDTNDIVKISKRRLHERYGHYDGIIIDIFYDHFLAKNWEQFSQIPLDIYAKSFYHLLEKNINILPEKTKQLLPSMIKYNWLYNYKFIEAIEKVLKGMNIRTQGKSKMNLAVIDLKEHYTDFENDFFLFFDKLNRHTEKTFFHKV